MVAGSPVAFKLFNKWNRRRIGDAEARATVAIASTLAPPATHSVASDDSGFPAPEATVNRLLPDVRFTDINGEAGSLRAYRGEILVVSMTSIGCPVSKKAVPSLARLPEQYGDGPVRFMIVNPDPGIAAADLHAHAAQFPGWRYVYDAEAKIARVLAARTTTETFIIDDSQTLRYRGCIDDRFDVGSVRQTEEFNDYLRESLALVVAHEKLIRPVTPAPGCVLDLAAPERVAPAPTWYNEISRFVQANCIECHRPGEAAPFSLETYEQVLAKKGMMEYVMEEKLMPPWFADPAYGHWRNARFLSEEDRLMFSAWVENGCEKGDPADAPTPYQWSKGWSIEDPQIVIDVEPQEIPAEGFLPWRIFPLPFEIEEDMWVSEAEIRPSVPEVVHHAMLFVEYAEDDPRRLTQTRGEAGENGGSEGYWLSYFPGRKCMKLPTGHGKLLPKGGRILVQLHYNPNGTPHVDATRIGLNLLPEPPEKEVVSGSVVKGDFVIPPNSRPEFVYSKVFAEDVYLMALMPHMHSRGASASVYLKHVDGRVETLLDVPEYDFDWQISYEFEEPFLVTKGTRIVIRHSYDNTPENPDNPDPTNEVRHGNATADEMMINFFEWEAAGEEPPAGTENRPFL